jgi:hypothetical protein
MFVYVSDAKVGLSGMFSNLSKGYKCVLGENTYGEVRRS